MRLGLGKLPPALLVFVHFEILFYLNAVITTTANAQQCHLVLQGAGNDGVLNPPTNGGNSIPSNGSHTTTTTTATEPGDSEATTSTTSRSSGTTASAATTTTASSTSTPSPTIEPFDYENDKIRGVNLGGWLVLEPWITPSVFERTGNTDIVDEYTLGELMDRADAERLLLDHWETWITEDDFIAIREAGLNHVRIPLGYWSVPLTSSDTSQLTSPDPYVPGAWTYLLRGLTWARKHGVHTVVDLHGAPLSQNGYDNSGQRTGDPRWALDSDAIARTVDTVRYIAENLGGMIDVLELLNEPAGFRGDDWASAIRQYWLDGYDAVRDAAGREIKIMIGDAFLGVNRWQNFLVSPRGHDVLIDFHEYQIFSDGELDRSQDDHVEFACGYVESLSTYASQNLWTVVGEWSNAMTDCARWLNGRGRGARWDNTFSDSGRYHGSCANYTGSYENFSDEYREFLRRYFEVQIEIGENVQGWVFWTWKAEEADEWSYQRGLEGGWIPRDPTDRLYPNICS